MIVVVIYVLMCRAQKIQEHLSNLKEAAIKEMTEIRDEKTTRHKWIKMGKLSQFVLLNNLINRSYHSITYELCIRITLFRLIFRVVLFAITGADCY